MELRIDRCEMKNKNKCETLHTIRHRKYCDLIVAQNDFTWRQFFQAIQPKWQCPLKKVKFNRFRLVCGSGPVNLWPKARGGVGEERATIGGLFQVLILGFVLGHL